MNCPIENIVRMPFLKPLRDAVILEIPQSLPDCILILIGIFQA
jgi:hypothetical protein